MSEYQHASTTCSFGVDVFQIQLHKFTCPDHPVWFELDLKMTDHVDQANDKDITFKNITSQKRKKGMKMLAWLVDVDPSLAKERFEYLLHFLNREVK
jgi:hypothetical protein